MDKWIEYIILASELSDEQRQELREAIASNVDVSRSARAWQQLQALARRRLRDEMGDPLLFYLFALGRAGHLNALTPDERGAFASLADRYLRLLPKSEGLRTIANEIGESADVFSSTWDAAVEESGHRDDATADGRAHRRERASRAASRTMARRGRSRSSIARWAVRGSVAAALLMFALIMTQVVQRDTGMTTVRTAVGEVRTIELSGGSRVRLLESSELSYREPASTTSLLRQASVIGRAYFEMTPQELGFIVKTPNARITVLGTTFGVEAFERLTEVVLAEGRLTLASESNLEAYVALEPGQMSRVASGGSPIQPLNVELPERLAWTGLFVFQSTPLRSIAEHLSRAFDVEITVDDALAQERVTGTFEQDQPLEEILSVIAEAVNARIAQGLSGDVEIAPL